MIRVLATPWIGAPVGGDLIREKLEEAITGAEGLHLVLEPSDGTPAALTLIEHVAGGHGTWRVHLVCGDDATACTSLERALAGAWSHGGRLAVAELPVHAAFDPLLRILRTAGFRDAGTVGDFFADGVALEILSREITP